MYSHVASHTRTAVPLRLLRPYPDAYHLNDKMPADSGVSINASKGQGTSNSGDLSVVVIITGSCEGGGGQTCPFLLENAQNNQLTPHLGF